MPVSHDNVEEKDTLSVCPACVKQSEGTGEECVVEAVGNLEVPVGGQVSFCSETPTNASHQEVGRDTARGRVSQNPPLNV